ncbi:MAG TPA: hypothetical protein PLL69_06830 [Gemmatimonadales bacterium]|nr:hypothetical protein [Gemmatimonadales bacterium]
MNRDTTRIEVGSPLIDASWFKPHRARVRVHLNSLDTPPVNEWTNELTIGDSAGRQVARWVTLGQFDSTGTPGFDLRQTFDHTTLALLGYRLQTRGGADVSLAIDGNRVSGTRKTSAASGMEQVDQVIPRMGFVASASDLVPLAMKFQAGQVVIAPLWGPNMATAESRIFHTVGEVDITVEGKPWNAWKVEEYRESDRRLMATWFLVEESPYMVAGEVYLLNGNVQKFTEVELP